MKLIVNKPFFGKSNCFKLILNENKECYFHFGLEKGEVYEWKKVKMSDNELGDILQVLRNEKPSIAFFHKFNDAGTQIWVNRKDKAFFIKVKELSKSFTEGEQEVLKVLITQIIWEMNKE